MNAAARVVALLTSAIFLLVALSAPALADAPSTWDEGESRSALENLIFFGGSTVGLIVVISLFALITARNNYVPPPPSTEVEATDHQH